MIYLGSLGRMIGIKCPASQQLSVSADPTFELTLEGRRVAQPPPRSDLREWSLQTSDATTPEQVAALMEFASGAWGPGPFVFVSADAPYTNMLSPRIASCDPSGALYAWTMPGGPMQAGDTWAARSYINTTPAQLLAFGSEYTPASPGQAVTVSAYVSGAGAKVRIYFYDAAGNTVTSSTSSVAATGSASVRSWITRVAPEGTVSCRVLAIDAVQASRPAMTWTDTLAPWSDGQGCPEALIHGVSRSLAQAGVARTYSNLSFTATEVG